MSGIISAPQFFRVFPDLDPDNVGHTHASTMQAFYTAIYEVGCLFGALFSLLYGNKVGRRRNMYIGTLCLGSLPQASLSSNAFRGLLRYDWDDNPDHLHTRSAFRVSLVGLFPKSDDSTKHLAGHQFVIGRIITGICPTFLSGSLT